MTNREKLFYFIGTLTEKDAKMLIPAVEAFLYFQTKNKANKFHEVIYCIKHNVTGKEYIGRTGAFENRIACHMGLLRNGKHPVEDMQSDFNVYGNDYTITILEEITDKEQRKREHELMLSRGSHIRGKGYNYKDECNRCRTRRKAENETKCRKNPIIAD